jgi:DNA-binding response OmpR family regulator
MILIAEDDKIMWKNLKLILDLNWYESIVVDSAEKAENLLESKRFDLIVLDINLPWKNWFEFLKQLRQQWNLTPVLILTSRSQKQDVILWLEIWADDYLTKPFDMEEFIARIKAILRRTQNYLWEKIVINWYEIYPEEQKVIKDWAEIWLSALEFRLLMYFIKNRGKVLSRKQIYEDVWWDFEDYMFSRTVDVYIWYLRKKLWKDFIKTKKWAWYYVE